MKHAAIGTLVVSALFAAGVQAAPSVYIGQQTRDIKALSPQEVADYLDGKGMGLAKAAELNGYAGPAHVLELAAQLELTPEQHARTQALFAAMSSQAAALGQALVERERTLDGWFADRTITAPTLASLLVEIAALQAKLRGAHLEAHLPQADILSPEQNARYAQLRGYGSAASSSSGHAGQHKH